MAQHPKIIIMYKGMDMAMGNSTINLKSSSNTYDELIDSFDNQDLKDQIENIFLHHDVVRIFTNIEKPEDINIMKESHGNVKYLIKKKLISFSGEIQIYFFGETIDILGGGKKQQKLTKSNQKLQIGNKTRVVYLGARGGRYIKMGGNIVPVSKLNKK